MASSSPPQPLADVLGPDVRLLLVGINPGLRSAALGRHFAGAGNRFWPALYAAGIVDEPLKAAEQHRLPVYGVGLTNLVSRPTARASDLAASELRAGAARLKELVDHVAPAVVAILGITAYRVAFQRPAARLGAQADMGTTRCWVLPNPSGLNAHAQLSDHVRHLRMVATEAGLTPQRGQ